MSRSGIRDQSHSDVERKVRPDPAEHDRKPIAYADQEKDVHSAPKPPCRRAGDLHPPKIRNRAPAADRGQAALVAIAERRRRFAAAQPRSLNRGYVGAALLCCGRQPGNRLASPSERKRGIANRKDIGVSRNQKIRADLDAAGMIRLGSEPRGGWRRNHPGRPQNGAGLDSFAIHDDPVSVDKFYPAIGAHLDAERFQ